MPRVLLALLAASCATSAARTVSPPSPALLDSDSDGLLDAEELAIGTDPALADYDDDGLLDGVESALGTDPAAPDTDRDGSWDGEEVKAYRDPLDASSLLYEGGWPYAQPADGC